MLISVTYLGHPARSCVSLTENVNYSAEKRGNCHWKHPHFSTDRRMKELFFFFFTVWIKYSSFYTSKAIVLV